MKLSKFYPITLFFTMLFLLSSAFGQNNTSIIAGTDTTGKNIIVKWFDKQIVFPQGVNIYRKTANSDWIKLNTKPIKKGDLKIPTTEIAKDSSLNTFIRAAETATTKDLQGIIGAMLVVKSVQNNNFARYMGLCYIDEDVVAGNTYQYKIMRIQGNQEALAATTKDIIADFFQPIVAPSGFTVKAGDAKADIKWNPEPDRFFGVNVYRFSGWDSAPVKANKEVILISKYKDTKGQEKYPDVFFTDINLNNHYQYTYFLKAIDYFGYEGATSEQFTIAPHDKTAPEPPQNMHLSVDGLKVTITWENPNPSEDLAGYNIYRSRRFNSDYQKANTILLQHNTFSFTDVAPKPGEYFYYVAAVDSAGNEGNSFKDMIDVKDVIPPSAPRGLIAKADSGKITLHWIANHEEDLMGYQIFRTVEKDNPAYYTLINVKPLTDTFFVDILPKNSKNKFHYKVAAIDSALNRSGYSDPIFGEMPDLIPPERPFIKKISQQERALLIEWIPNVEADLKSYDIFRKNINDSVLQKLNIKPINRQTNKFTDYDVKPRETYKYCVTATDSANNISDKSEYFFTIFVAENLEEMKSPITKFNVSYKPGNKQVALSWSLENDDNIKGITIFRKENASFVPLTGLINNSSYQDKDIAEGNEYSYRINIYLESGEVFKSEEIKVTIKQKNK